MNMTKQICMAGEQGVVHVDVPVGRPGQRVEVLFVWDDVSDDNGLKDNGASVADVVGVLEDGDLERAPQDDENARRARLQRYTTWTEDELREFQAGLAAQRVVDPKL